MRTGFGPFEKDASKDYSRMEVAMAQDGLEGVYGGGDRAWMDRGMVSLGELCMTGCGREAVYGKHCKVCHEWLSSIRPVERRSFWRRVREWLGI